MRRVRACQRHTYTGLENPIAAHDATKLRVVVSPVERVGDRTGKHLRCVTWQHCVGIERYHIPHLQKGCGFPDNGEKRIGPVSPKEPVELPELSTLPLPAHPHALALIPDSTPVKEVEDTSFRARILGVELLNSAHCRSKYPGIVRLGFRVSVSEVAQNREVQIAITVCEVLYLDVRKRFVHRAYTSEQCRNYHRRPALRGDAFLAKLQLRQEMRRHQQRHELVHDTDRYFIGGYQR